MNRHLLPLTKTTLITSDLQSIPKALELSKKTVLGIHQNLFWAFIYNIIRTNEQLQKLLSEAYL